MAEARSAAGEGDVERFARLFAGRLFGRDALRFFFERALHAIAQLVERVADVFFLLFRDFLEPREERRDQSALAAEVVDAHLVERSAVVRVCKRAIELSSGADDVVE